MNKGAETTVKALRDQLLEARQERDLAMLRNVEDGLRQLGKVGYRCCLVDFDRCRLRYYVRLLGYEQARVKVQIEFPIALDVDPVQWLPLSHLADYEEAQNPYSIRRIYESMARYIQQKSPTLQRGAVRLGLKSPRRQADEKIMHASGKRRGWFYCASALVLLVVASLFFIQMDHGFQFK